MIQIVLIILIAAGLFFLQRYIYGHYWEDGLSVSTKFQSAEITENTESTLQVVIENDKKLPLPMLMVKFQTDRSLVFASDRGSATTDQFYHNDVFQIGSGERVTRKLLFSGKKRGYYKINNIDLTTMDLFMSKQFHASSQPGECLYVLPKPYESRDFQFMLQQLSGEMITKRNLYEDPFELRGIREYQPYDDMRSINWKATAKTGQFMVNQKNYTAPKTVRIFLDLEDSNILKRNDCLEVCIRIGAGLAKYLIEQGIKVSFYSNGLDIETGDPMMRNASSRGSQQLSVILRSLARIDLQKEAKPFEQLFRRKILNEQDNGYTCFISPNHKKEYLEILQECSTQGRSFSWFCPSYGTFTVSEIPPILRSRLKMLHL